MKIQSNNFMAQWKKYREWNQNLDNQQMHSTRLISNFQLLEYAKDILHCTSFGMEIGTKNIYIHPQNHE